jgi:hypothetical protein
MAEAFKGYLDHLWNKCSETYRRKAEVAFLSRIRPAFGNIRLSSLTLGKIDRYVAGRHTASQKRNDRAFVSSLLTWLVSVGVLEKNFMRGSYVPDASIARRFSDRDERTGTEEALRLLNPSFHVPEPSYTLLGLVALTGFPVMDFLYVLRGPTSPGELKLQSYIWSIRFPKVRLGRLAHDLSSMTGPVPPHLSGRTIDATRRRIATEAAHFVGDSHLRGASHRKTAAKLVEGEITRLRLNLEEWEQHLRQILDERPDPIDEVTL